MKTPQLKCISFVVASLILLISSCKDDDLTQANSGSMTATVNGTTWTATTSNNSLIKASDIALGTDVKRMDIRGTASDNSQLILSFTDIRDGKTGDNMRLDTWYVDILNLNNYCTPGTATQCNGFIGTYLNGTISNVTVPTVDAGTITVSSCSGNKISGTFEFIITDFFTGDTTYTVTNGTFTDLDYTIVSQ